MKSKRKKCLILALTLVVGLLGAQPPGVAAQNPDEETPAFTSDTAVNKAEQAVARAASQTQPEVAAAITAETKAAKALAAAGKAGNRQSISAAQDAHLVSEKAAQLAMAQICGVKTDAIAAMRNDHMGWGQIAQEFGMNPNTIGMARDQSGSRHSKSRMSPVTGRNTVTGRSTMTGFNASQFSSQPGMGLSHDAQRHGSSQMNRSIRGYGGGMSGGHGGDDRSRSRDAFGGGGRGDGGRGGGGGGGGGGGCR